MADAITPALALLQAGYQTDQKAIADGIAAGVADAVAQATAPLQAQVDTLTAHVDDFTAQMIAVQATPATLDTSATSTPLTP